MGLVSREFSSSESLAEGERDDVGVANEKI